LLGDTPAYVTPYAGPGGVSEDPRHGTSDEIRAKLARAVRYRDMAA
jgi:hypothetical protein